MSLAPRRRLRTAALLWSAIAFLFGVVAPAARANTYDVWSCHTAAGTPTSAAGWRGWSQLLYDEPSSDCGRGGHGLTAKFSAREGGVAGGLLTGWTFRAPSGTTIARVRVAGKTVARPAADTGGVAARAGMGDLSVVSGAATAQCQASVGNTACHTNLRTAGVAVPSRREWSVYAGCIGSMDGICARGAGSRAVASIKSARITLTDDSAPRGTVAGTAVESNAVRGHTSLRLSASDIGSGVWEAQIQIGSSIVRQRAPIDARGGRCDLVPGTKAFGAPQPCPRKLARTIPFDVSKVSDGSQMLTVTIWDAANNPTIVAFKPILVDNAHHVRADGTILMPAPNSATLSPIPAGPGGKSSGDLVPPIAAADPSLQSLLTAMNTLGSMRLPYCWGGGHQSTPAIPSAGSYCWIGDPAQKSTNSGSVGFDCSSSVSWVLQQIGLDVPTQTSGEFMNWGEPGPGKAVTIWTNPTHVFMEVEVAGHIYYWGTSVYNPQHGPGWHPPRSTDGFVARHPAGM